MTNQIIFQYQTNSHQKGQCGFTLIPMGLAAIVILGGLPGDVGVSITNGFEEAATEAYQRYLMSKGITPDKIVWVEYYPTTHLRREESFDRVIMHWDNEKECFLQPQWSSLGRNGLQKLMRSFGVKEDVPV